MKLSDRFKQPRLLRRDWIGDAVLTIVCAAVLVAAVFLPWVNDDGKGWVNFSLHGATGLNGVLDTHWGAPALLLALTAVVVGVVMLLLPPRRFSWLLGALVAALGVAVFGVAQDAAAHIGFLDPGVGMYLTTLVGILLVPIGLAAALVARFLARAEASRRPRRRRAALQPRQLPKALHRADRHAEQLGDAELGRHRVRLAGVQVGVVEDPPQALLAADLLHRVAVAEVADRAAEPLGHVPLRLCQGASRGPSACARPGLRPCASRPCPRRARG